MTVTPELDALVRACFATPKANLPRLVLADYLDEQGENDRATILRIQCELPPPKEKSDKPKIARGTVKPLKEAIDRLKPRLAILKQAGYRFQFQRGFLSVRLSSRTLRDTGTLMNQVAELFREGWIETVTVRGMHPGYMGELLGVLRNAGVIDFETDGYGRDVVLSVGAEFRPDRPDSRIQRLEVSENHRSHLAQILNTPTEATAEVRESQSYNSLTPESAQLLVESGTLNGVKELTLGGNPGEEAFRQLVQCPAFRHLSRLILYGLQVPVDALNSLWSMTTNRLDFLCVSGLRIGDEGVRSLCGGTFLPKSGLTLADAGLTAASAPILTQCKVLARADFLCLSGAALGDGGVATILRSPTFAKLSRAIVTACGATLSATLGTLFAVPNRRRLEIHLDGLALGLERPRRGKLRLWITGTNRNLPHLDWPDESTCAELLGEFGLTGVLASSDNLRRIRPWLGGRKLDSLSLTNTRLQSESFPDFLELLASVTPRHLDLAHNRLNIPECRALAACPAFASVETLRLTDNPVRVSGLLALADSPHRKSLRELTASNCRLTLPQEERVREAFSGVKVTF